MVRFNYYIIHSIFMLNTFLVGFINTNPQQIPIGAIFTSDDTESKDAFLLAIDLFNERNNSRFKLQPIVNLIHKNEPFTFTHQCKIVFSF